MMFSGKTAIVTGGTGALGSVCVDHLFNAGLNIAIPYNSEKSLANIPKRVAQSPDKLLTIKTDLTVEDQVESFVAQVVKRFGTIDYLVNTAGGYAGGSTIDEVALDEWEGIMKLNMRTAFLICRGVLRVMRKQSFGRIVNIAAMPALSPSARKGPYAISKRAVVTLTETIAEETKGTGVTANAIAPSIILTDANRESMPKAEFSKWVTPQEIAQLILYLCSDESKSVSGNVIKIYGGV
jgi:NAD(P)-dependent dehydrogenase (short-subunit alcohol dehydrogenase family)